MFLYLQFSEVAAVDISGVVGVDFVVAA